MFITRCIIDIKNELLKEVIKNGIKRYGKTTVSIRYPYVKMIV